ncbi:glycosyltransferase family 2 protein [Algoriphagus sp. Y33]|uniref:glycosyltransferase family 2 protein n=1 Tax=Algoriphagus sp. Y33 TaxID=2772483 RepID=UPI0017863B75|nr:glycosyltransferase family 2 protein [Algoriphagus sp. Y33]
MEVIFVLCSVVILYTYLGYGFVIFILVKLRRSDRPSEGHSYFPTVSLIIPFHNERLGLRSKIENTLNLDYPPDKLEIIFVSDGSDDGSERIPLEYSSIKAVFIPRRGGKIAAMKKAAAMASGEILVFSDANTSLNIEAIQELTIPYRDLRVGGVTGEKRIITLQSDGASSKGEGIYWKYESFLKKYDSYYYTLVGGDGGLMSFRRVLLDDIPDDTILDDFMLTMRMAEKGYLVKYTPLAKALEFSSSSVNEEMKRKIRIAAGGWQSIVRLRRAINPFHDLTLSFQYVSHRVLRWAVVPFLLPLVFLLNHVLVFASHHQVWVFLLMIQYCFYGLALLGYLMRNRPVKVPGFFVPYYFFVMNYCAVLGFFRWFRGRQAVTWQRAERANEKGL